MNQTTAVDTVDETFELLNDEQLSDIKKKSVSGAISYFVRTLFLNGIGLITSLILSAYFTANDYAVFGYVTQFIGLLVFFSDIGLAASLIQKKVEPTLRDYRTVFTTQFTLSGFILLATLGIALSGIVQQTVGDVGVWILLALGVSFPLATLKTISSIKLERELKFSTLVLPQIAEQLIFNGLLIGLALKGYGVMSYTYAILGRSIIGTVIMFYLKPWSIGLAFDRSAIKSLLGFGAKFQVNDFLARIKDNLFLIVMARFMTTAEYGQMSWAKSWSMYPYNLTVQNVMAITFPTFSRLQGNPQALKRAIEKSIFFITTGILPLLVGMCIFIVPLISIVDRYQKWEPAILSFIFFALSIGWAAVSTPLTNTLNAIGHINQTLKLMVMWTVLTWVITPIAVWLYGYNGVAVAAFIISLTSVVPVYYVKKIVPIAMCDQVWRQLLAAVLMALVGILGMSTWSKDISWMIFGMMAVGMTYILTLFAVGKRKLLTEFKSLR